MVIFTSLPFAVEIKVLIDYVLNTTTLDMWQFMQLFQYHSDLYIARTGNESYNRKKLGEPVTDCLSRCFFGYCCLAIVFSFVIGPFFLFSSIGSTTLFNPVQTSTFQFWIEVNQHKQIEFTDDETGLHGESESIQKIPFKIWDDEAAAVYHMTEAEITAADFNDKPETKFFTHEQIQIVEIATFSDDSWILSQSARLELQKWVCLAYL